MATAQTLAKKTIKLFSQDGAMETCIDGVQLHRISVAQECRPTTYNSWIVLLLQGEKRLHLESGQLKYDAESVLCVAGSTTIRCEVPATPQQPVISILLNIRFEDLLALALKIVGPSGPDTGPKQLVDVFPMSEEVRATLTRLVNLIHNPDDASVLGRATVDELVYWVMKNGFAETLAWLATNRKATAILKSINTIQDRLADELSINDLAARASMSTSSFHAHFKQITGLPPQRYIKSLRLGRAKEHLESGRAGVAEAAYLVGYKSPSQFSREYKRHFDVPPIDHSPKS